MGYNDRATSELCKAFKQAMQTVSADTLLTQTQIDEAVGKDMTNIRNGRARPTEAIIESVDAVFPGFKTVFEEYLLGISRLVSIRGKAMSNEVSAQNADFEAKIEFWQKKYLEEKEAHMDLLYKIMNKKQVDS